MPMQAQVEDTNEKISDVDLEMMLNVNGYNVVSGCATSLSGSDMVATIAGGEVTFDGTSTTVAGNTVTLVSDGSNPRWAYIGVNSSGVAIIIHGTAASDPNPPELTTDVVVIYKVKIATSQSNADNSTVQLDKRVPAPPASIKTNAWEHIDTQVLAAAATDISFPSISTAYKLFRLTLYLVQKTGTAAVILRLNNDSATNYDFGNIELNNTSVGGTQNAGQTSLELIDNMQSAAVSVCIVHIAKEVTTEHAAISSIDGGRNQASTASRLSIAHGRWANTDALISQIDVIAGGSLEFDISSRATLEGVKLLT